MNFCFDSESSSSSNNSSEEEDSDHEEDVKNKGSRSPSAEESSEQEDSEVEDTAVTSEESENDDDEDENEDDDDGNDDLPTDPMSFALAVAKGTEASPGELQAIRTAADEFDDDEGRLHLKYILCAQAAQHSGFIEPDYFGNLAELLSTDNAIIRQCIMWAFASILPCKNVLSPLLIRLLYKSLKDETLGWSISYLFRKMSEYEKYIPMVTCAMWISMSKILFDLRLSEQVRTTIVYTLNNVYKVRKWVAPVIKLKFEQVIQIDGIGIRVLVATVHALHSMAIGGAKLEEETVSRLRTLATTGDPSSIESIHELLDFLDNKRILSNAVGSLAGSSVKKELTATQNTSVSRSEEESVEPTMKIHSMDHLLSTVGHLGRTFNAEAKPIDVREGHNQAWYRTTWYEVSNLATLAKTGQLKDQDFDYLVTKFRHGVHWSVEILNSQKEIFEMIAGAFRDAAEIKQAMPQTVLNVMIDRLSGANDAIHRKCAEALLLAVKNRQSLSEEQMEKLEEKLKHADDTVVKQHLIELLALYVSKGHHFKLDLESIGNDLLNKDTCEATSYLFFRAAALEKRTFSERILTTLAEVAGSNRYEAKTRDNCLWALAYSIKENTDKTSIPSEVIDELGEMLTDHEKSVKQTAAVALCYYADDEKTVLSTEILEKLAEMLNETDYGLLNNILSVYLRMSKQGERVPDVALKKLSPLFYHEDFSIREKAIWILKYVVDNRQEVKLKIIDQIDGCLNDSEFNIRNPAALIFIGYWREQVEENDRKLLRILSVRMESFISTIFRQAFNLDVQRSGLNLLRSLVEKKFVLSESLLHLIECCLYDREETISEKSIDIVQIYSKGHPLPKTTLVCLEHLLTTETPILPVVISILKSIVGKGHRLSKKAIDILAQLLFKSPEPKEITTLLTHGDRNQPLPKSIDELLRQIYYGKILEHSTCSASLNKATKELLHSTSQGKPLSVSVLDLIVRQLESDEKRTALMPILVNVVSNGQSLSKDNHRSILEGIFFETLDEPSIDLMEIFTHLTRQNQIISEEIIDELQKYLTNSSINHFVIEIYQHLIERQKPFDSAVVTKVFKFFKRNTWEDLNEDFQHRLALFYKAVADNRPNEADQKYLPCILKPDQSIRVRKEICTAIQLLAEHGEKLPSTTIDVLIKLIDGDDDSDLQQIALEILHRVRSTDRGVNANVSKFLDLLQCNDQTDDRILLQQLKDATTIGVNLPETLIVRLSHMLYSCDVTVKKDAAMILAANMSKEKTLSRQVLDVISLTLLDETINRQTLPLLSAERTFSSSMIDDLLYLAKHSTDHSVRQCARQILATQLNNNQTKVDLFFEYLNSKMHIDDQTDFRQTLKFLRATIIVEKHLPVEQLLSHFSGEYQDEIVDLLLFAHQQNVEFHHDQRLVESMDNALQRHSKPKLIQLMGILTRSGVIVQEKTLKRLFDIFAEQQNESALMAIEHAAQHQALPENLLMYFVEFIANPLEEMFIARSFSIIRQQLSQGYIQDSLGITRAITLPSIIDIDRLEEIQSIEERLGTIETLLFVDYLQPDVFERPVDQWSRDCLCIEIITNCSDTTNDRIISFYQQLTQFEQIKTYKICDDRRDTVLRRLIEKQRAETLTLSTINDILIYATIATDTPLKILQSNQSDWLAKMRFCYIKNQLEERFSDLQYPTSLIDHLVQRLAKEEKLSSVFVDLCLRTIRSADDVLKFLDLFTNYDVKSTDLIDVFFQGQSPSDFDALQKKLQLAIIGKTLKSHWIGSNASVSRARTALQTLIQRGWTVPKLLAMLTAKAKIEMSSDASENLIYLVDVLKIFVDYNVDSNITSHLQSICAQKKTQLWPSVVYSQVIEHAFGSSSSEKNLAALVSELHQLNPQIDQTALLTKYKNIELSYESRSRIISVKETIESWSKSTIQEWAKTVRRSDRSKPTINEMIAVMKRAVYLDSNFEPRPIQIFAILILLDAKGQGGRLLQILTGEGKSTVVSMLAVIKALQNEHVDIITSSITLAKRDAHERKSFYDYFNVTVAHNNDETSYTSGPKQCYQSDIVYGNSSQFQFDLLRHEFSLLNTRTLDKQKGMSRRFDAVIIDEVDSMLIDDNNTLARLADQLPGMEWLNPLLYGVWRCIDSEAKPESKRDAIIDNMRKLLTDPNSDLKLPTHLTRFVYDSIPTWVDHAILAKVEYRLDHHYMIKPDETRTKRIMPIDFSNTGSVQPSTTWSDGLHQFLQIKHGLKMTALTVTTNYLSNMGLFTRYGKNIFGLTGTIGSKDAQNLLQRIYQVDTIIIPSFKQKRHIQLKTTLTENDDEWLKTIVSETISNARKQRGILVICETRLDAKTISKQIQRADPTCLVRLYTDNTDAVESNVVGDRIQNGEIIVATNLAGRGTDLKTSPTVEKNGGLHVCLTFLPNNLRVEEQAFGRTSRQGNRGTSQMILSRDRTLAQLMSTHPEYATTRAKNFADPIDLFRDWREHAERAHLERMWRDEIVDIKLKDELFQRFCKLLGELRKKNDNVYRLLSVKEEWGLWLKSMDYVTQNRLALRLFLERQGLTPEDVTQDGHSFFHALSRQIDGELTAEQIKDQVIQHMIDHFESYTNVTEEERHQATSEALKMNLIIYRTDSRSPHIYQQEDAVHTCVIGYEVDAYYFSLRSRQSGDGTRTATQTDHQQKSRPQKLFNQFKRLVDQSKHQKDTFNNQLATRIIEHDLRTGLTAFEKKMSNDYNKDDFIRNPCYLLMEAETIISKLSTWSNSARSWVEVLPWTDKQAVTYKEAVDRLEKAIKLDPIFTFPAQVNRAHFLIDQETSTDLYKVKAKAYLVRAQEILGTYILPQLHSMQLETKKSDDELIYDDLVNQTRLKVDILQLYQSHVGQAIATIEDSQKLVDVTVIDEDNDDRVVLGKKLYRDEVKTFLNNSSGVVRLGFHSLKCHEDVWKHDQALKLLKLLSKEDERVTIHFLEGSKKNIEEFESIVSCQDIQLNIEYLDSNELHPLIEFSKNIDLKLTATTEDYLKVIKAISDHVESTNNSDHKRKEKSRKRETRKIIAMNENIELITDKHRLPLKTAREALATLESDGTRIESILFKSIRKEQVDFILLHVSRPSFALTFNSLTIDRLKEIVKDVKKPFNYQCRNLSISKAQKLIEKNTDRSFILLIENLSVDRAKKIVKKFDPKEQDVKTSLKRLAEQFSKANQEYEELTAYGLVGISLLITLDELGPRPWISVTIVVALGACQIAGGIALTALTGGLGVSLGISLIGEGVNDIVFGVRGALSRRFSWKDYAIQKGISLAICFTSLGFSAVVQAVKGVQAVGVTGAASVVQATRQGTMAIIKNSFRTVGSGAIKGISSTSWLLACKQVAVTCAETGARELANYFSEAAYQGILAEVKSTIRAEIESSVRTHQKDKHYQRIFNRALAVDRYYGKDDWRNQIEQIAMNILTKNKDQFVETVQSLSKGITNAFLNHSRQIAGEAGGYVQTAQLLMTIVPILKGAQEIRTLTDSFFAQYKKELNVLEEKIPTIEDLLLHASNQEFSSSTTKDIVIVLEKRSILNSDGLLDARFSQDDEEEANLSNAASFMQSSDGPARTPKEKLLSRLRKVTFEEDRHRSCAETVLLKIVDAQNHRSFRVGMFQKKIVDMLLDQVCALIYGTMVAPMMNYVISRAISALSTAAQLKMNPDGTVMEQLMEEGAKRYIHGVANDFVDKYNEGELQVDPSGKEKLEKLVERCEKQGGQPENLSEELALGVRGGKQGGVIELCILAMITKKPVTVLQQELNDGSNADEGSIQMVYTAPTIDKATGKVIDGHYELAGGTTAKGDQDDCLYTAILSKTHGQFPSVDEMRTQCAAFILTNPGFISGIHPALSIINQTRNPIRRKELMGEGGAKINHEIKDVTVESDPAFKKRLENEMKKLPKGTTDEQRKEFIKNLMIQFANESIILDMKTFAEKKATGHISNTAVKEIQKQIDDAMGAFHEQNRNEKLVDTEIMFTVGNFKMGFSINADPKNENPKLPQENHLGCDMYATGTRKESSHKYLPPKTLKNHRPPLNEKRMCAPTGDHPGANEAPDPTIKLPTGETVEIRIQRSKRQWILSVLQQLFRRSWNTTVCVTWSITFTHCIILLIHDTLK